MAFLTYIVNAWPIKFIKFRHLPSKHFINNNKKSVYEAKRNNKIMLAHNWEKCYGYDYNY